jgi:general stress protein CsbA
LAGPDLIAWPEVPEFTHAHIDCYKHNYKHDKAANDNAHKLNHIILILLVKVRRTRWSRTLLLATLLYGRIMVKKFNNFFLAGISVLLFCYIFFCFSQLIIPVKCLQETG